MSHETTVRREFSRQAQAFAAAPVLREPEVTDRIAEALGAESLPRLLDLACGPGVLTPTLAPRAGHLVSFDLTPAVLRLGREAASAAGLTHVSHTQGAAERLPFADGCFDAAVVRLALHHLERPAVALAELRRVLRDRGRVVVLDLLTSEDLAESKLHNAIERLRDPSHRAVRPEAELRELLAGAGFRVSFADRWTRPRRFYEWAAIIADPVRTDSLETVLRQLAQAGRTAGIDLRETDGALWFDYTWCLLVAEPDAPGAAAPAPPRRAG